MCPGRCWSGPTPTRQTLGLGGKEKEETPDRDLQEPTERRGGVLPRHPRAGAGQDHPGDRGGGGERLDLTVNIIETGGQSLRSQLVRTDLSGCLMSDCDLCESKAGGDSHTRRGCVYSGTCKECEKEGTTAKYFSEYGRSGYHQMKEHARDIKAKNIKNGFSKHLHC